MRNYSSSCYSLLFSYSRSLHCRSFYRRCPCSPAFSLIAKNTRAHKHTHSHANRSPRPCIYVLCYQPSWHVCPFAISSDPHANPMYIAYFDLRKRSMHIIHSHGDSMAINQPKYTQRAQLNGTNPLVSARVRVCCACRLLQVSVKWMQCATCPIFDRCSVHVSLAHCVYIYARARTE